MVGPRQAVRSQLKLYQCLQVEASGRCLCKGSVRWQAVAGSVPLRWPGYGGHDHRVLAKTIAPPQGCPACPAEKAAKTVAQATDSCRQGPLEAVAGDHLRGSRTRVVARPSRHDWLGDWPSRACSRIAGAAGRGDGPVMPMKMRLPTERTSRRRASESRVRGSFVRRVFRTKSVRPLFLEGLQQVAPIHPLRSGSWPHRFGYNCQ